MENQKKPSNNIAKSLVESLSTSKMTEIVTEFSDIAFDMVSNQEDGFLKEIPIFGWFIKGHGAFITMRDRIFMKKIANFLYGTATVSEEDREKFKNDISNDQELSQKVGETLILLLDRHEDFEKSLILGKIFAGYMKGEIDYITFSKLAHIIDRAFIDDLKNLEKYYSKSNEYEPSCGKPFSTFLDNETCQSLYAVGLIRAEGYVEDIYHPNQIGEHFLKLLKA
ncbi:hypothetical protein [Anabaena sp. PCC 7108]|uniref:hypothetical protein n=1 Tax=Anabaena sp. PCC 7108 TaxID=163908 RepID=UPI0003467797|nr:hypothetical protein [Anabaena sp. PCC 7108]